jgi:hypothetical protein
MLLVCVLQVVSYQVLAAVTACWVQFRCCAWCCVLRSLKEELLQQKQADGKGSNAGAAGAGASKQVRHTTAWFVLVCMLNRREGRLAGLTEAQANVGRTLVLLQQVMRLL